MPNCRSEALFSFFCDRRAQGRPPPFCVTGCVACGADIAPFLCWGKVHRSREVGLSLYHGGPFCAPQVMVLGAGRGPLVEAAVKAAAQAEVPAWRKRTSTKEQCILQVQVELYAVEKNPNAVRALDEASTASFIRPRTPSSCSP